MFKTVPSLQASPLIERRKLGIRTPSPFSSRTLSTVSEGNPVTLSSSNTHPSFLDIKRSIGECQLPPARRPPNLLRKERSLHLTKSAQRLPERDCRRRAHDTPKDEASSLPVHSLLLHTKLFGQPYLHISPKPGEKSLSDRRALSSAILCRPIKAHVFTVSAETQGPNSTNSLRTVGSFFRRKKKSPPCGPYFLGTFQCVEAVRIRTLSHESKQGQTLSHKSVPHLWHHA